MTHTESLPLDIPPTINEATGVWEQFGKLGYDATRSLLNMGVNPFLRGSRLTRMLLPESKLGKFDEIRKLMRHSQRVTSVGHFGPAADPDTQRPVDNQIELKLPIPVTDFAHIVKGLRASMKIPTEAKILEVPAYLHPTASEALQNSYERLQPKQRIIWTDGVIPGRNMPYAGVQLEADWVGAGSTHSTKLPLTYWRVYPTGGDTDMRNPKNCTNVDGLWGKIINKNGILSVQLPEAPSAVYLPDSAIKLHEKNLDDKANIQAAINVADVLTRGLRIGASLGIPFTPEHTKLASKWMSIATPRLKTQPPDNVTKIYIRMNIKAAQMYDPKITQDFLNQVDFSAIGS